MITVRVPASSANLGPGFDCLGMALDIYNTFTFEKIKEGLEFEGFHDKYCNEHNMVYKAFLTTLKKIKKEVSGVKISANSQIPVSRGLGSSSACIVAGVVGANALTGDTLNREEVFQIASQIEGHPDNTAPAVFGGLTVSSCYDEQFYTQQTQVAKGLSFYALVPDFEVSTAKAREALPKTIDYKDAVFNVSSVAMLLEALRQGNFELLPHCLNDRLHQPYRKHLIPGFDEIVNIGYKKGAKGVFISGAGPTILVAFQTEEESRVKEIVSVLDKLPHHWMIKKVALDTKGYEVL